MSSVNLLLEHLAKVSVACDGWLRAKSCQSCGSSDPLNLCLAVVAECRCAVARFWWSDLATGWPILPWCGLDCSWFTAHWLLPINQAHWSLLFALLPLRSCFAAMDKVLSRTNWASSLSCLTIILTSVLTLHQSINAVAGRP